MNRLPNPWVFKAIRDHLAQCERCSSATDIPADLCDAGRSIAIYGSMRPTEPNRFDCNYCGARILPTEQDDHRATCHTPPPEKP